MTEEPRPGRGTTTLVLGALVWVAGTVLAFTLLDWVPAAFLVILGATVLAMAAAARGWDQQSTYEQREAARARRRQEKWDRGAAARARDRARWEAHQARQAEPGGEQQ